MQALLVVGDFCSIRNIAQLVLRYILCQEQQQQNKTLQVHKTKK